MAVVLPAETAEADDWSFAAPVLVVAGVVAVAPAVAVASDCGVVLAAAELPIAPVDEFVPVLLMSGDGVVPVEFGEVVLGVVLGAAVPFGEVALVPVASVEAAPVAGAVAAGEVAVAPAAAGAA